MWVRSACYVYKGYPYHKCKEGQWYNTTLLLSFYNSVYFAHNFQIWFKIRVVVCFNNNNSYFSAHDELTSRINERHLLLYDCASNQSRPRTRGRKYYRARKTTVAEHYIYPRTNIFLILWQIQNSDYW